MAWTSPQTWTTSQVVTAADMNTDVRDNLGALNPLDSVAATSWTPIVDGTTSSWTGTTTGRYWRVGPLVYAAARCVFAQDGEVVGTFFVTLPVAYSGVSVSTAVGSWRGTDVSSSANNTGGQVMLSSDGTSDTIRFVYDGGSNVTDSLPFTWAASDQLTFFAVYPAA